MFSPGFFCAVGRGKKSCAKKLAREKNWREKILCAKKFCAKNLCENILREKFRARKILHAESVQRKISNRVVFVSVLPGGWQGDSFSTGEVCYND